MKPLLAFCLLFTALNASAVPPITIKLWPQGAPEPAGFQIEPEKETKREPDDGVQRLTNVSEPMMTIFKPEKPNGSAVLVCPGGGYSILAYSHEGSQVCEFLNQHGVTAVLLKYRVPRRDPANPSREPLQDAQRAMGILRHRASEFGILADRIGVLGFSAGGHLSVMLALHANERTYTADPALDVEDATPNFAVPVYPAYLTVKGDDFKSSPEVVVTAKSPPMCLVHANDDRLSASASALLYLEYKKQGVPCELHIYSKGGHGFGMKKSGTASDSWAERVADWMKASGYLQP
jgi:acetyl esterase/lipase